jgi:hypothetical protein
MIINLAPRASGPERPLPRPIRLRKVGGMGAVTRSPYFQSWPNTMHLSGYVDTPWLQRWPSGLPMSRANNPTLGSYVDAPWLTKWPSGRPIKGAPGTQTKHDLVVMALTRATNKKRNSRGLGDMIYDPSTDSYIDTGTGQTDTSGGQITGSIPYTVDPYSINVIGNTIPVDTTSAPISGSLPYGVVPTFPTSSPTQNWSTSSQGISQSIQNALAPILNAFKSSPTSAAAQSIYSTPTLASGIGSSLNNLGTTLSARPIASVPVSYGGILLLGGGAILLTSLMGGKRRRR